MRVPTTDDHMNLYPWWKNFFFNTIDYNVSIIERIDRNLKPYNAKLIRYKDGRHHLEFDKEQDYVMFVLRWS